MKGSYCEWNIYIDETFIFCNEKDILWLCVLYYHNWKYAEMLEKSALLTIRCDISSTSLKKQPSFCENCAKAIKKL